MTKAELKKLIQTASGQIPAETVIRNCRVLDVFTGVFREGDIALCGGLIAGVGRYCGREEIDGEGRFAVPGLIDSHIHIESSYLCPEELGRLLVPHGTTAIIADPHEIVNVCGTAGLDYMMAAAENTALDILFMLPSCVPATAFEHAGAEMGAAEMAEPLRRSKVLGLGEFMNFPGLLSGEDGVLDKLLLAREAGKLIDGHSPGLTGPGLLSVEDGVLDKLLLAHEAGKLIDGHSPGLTGLGLNGYAAAGILGDHECGTVEAMEERLALGMYVLLRQGSACHDLRALIPGVTQSNSRRCLLCSDDRQPRTILQEGHIDSHLRICVEEGLDAVTALRMATLNAAECFRLYDRGAIAPGRRGDIVLLDDLTDFHVDRVWIHGQLAAADGEYLLPVRRQDITPVMGSVRVKDFTAEKLKMRLKSGHVHVIELRPGSVETKKSTATVQLDSQGEFIWTPEADIAKVAVIERHRETGHVACGFLKGYGIRAGAIALSVAHDSHNIIVTGVSDDEMACAVEKLREQNGGIVLVKDGAVLESMPMPIAGLMSDRSGEWVAERLDRIHRAARTHLGISSVVEPVMTLCFMSLPVIPELKLTDMGLFDVTQFSFIPVEVRETDGKISISEEFLPGY